ncbi:replication fork protection component Swi3-domain-containing protein [Ilyonectria robusta]|uniref:replication fork protection component Swi3-domain-containing protein n=1 Tax=Ilyonectria robusta TaxID=1079257 RepID=UPI001E8DA5E0|nr:replication fork protection component Swi3-domain-containing protein [Ilyonectria robusta]KAH8686607.1 replication fork protection component Swi3-domain-containing protein [Ilyonectria robusta]
MPSALSSGLAAAERHDDLDNYDADNFSDDPFGSPPPTASTKKRKEPESGLGIDKEVSVQKRARVPNVKLDEERLLSENGIPKLRTRARDLKIKGKGHEFSDAGRLLSFYQLWLDDLFPKAKFLDALGMVEKAGHKKRIMIARNDFINEGKPKDAEDREQDEDDDATGLIAGLGDSDRGTAAAAATQRPKTPARDPDIPDDDDLYDATPRASRPIVPILNDQPEEDDMEALIAEAEGQDRARNAKPAGLEPDEDDLDALMAEAEGQDQPRQAAPETRSSGENMSNDFDDDEAALQEMEGLW